MKLLLDTNEIEEIILNHVKNELGISKAGTVGLVILGEDTSTNINAVLSAIEISFKK